MNSFMIFKMNDTSADVSMSTHAYIPDTDIVLGLHPDNLIGDALFFSLIMVMFLLLFYLLDLRFFFYHHQ